MTWLLDINNLDLLKKKLEENLKFVEKLKITVTEIEINLRKAKNAINGNPDIDYADVDVYQCLYCGGYYDDMSIDMHGRCKPSEG